VLRIHLVMPRGRGKFIHVGYMRMSRKAWHDFLECLG